MIGLLSAVAIPAFLRYTVEAREAAVEERDAVEREARRLEAERLEGLQSNDAITVQMVEEQHRAEHDALLRAEQARHECEQKLEEVLSRFPDPAGVLSPPPAGSSRKCINEGTPQQECFTCPGDPRCG